MDIEYFDENKTEQDSLQLGIERAMRFLDEAEGKHAIIDGYPPSTLELENMLNAIYKKGWELITILQNPTDTYWKMIFRRRKF